MVGVGPALTQYLHKRLALFGPPDDKHDKDHIAIFVA